MQEAEHYDLAVQLAEEARDRLGLGDSQGTLACAAVAQVYATLALAAVHKPDYGEVPSLPPEPAPFILTTEDGTPIEVTPEMRRAAVRDVQMGAKYGQVLDGYALEDGLPWPNTAPDPQSGNND